MARLITSHSFYSGPFSQLYEEMIGLEFLYLDLRVNIRNLTSPLKWCQVSQAWTKYVFLGMVQ